MQNPQSIDDFGDPASFDPFNSSPEVTDENVAPTSLAPLDSGDDSKDLKTKKSKKKKKKRKTRRIEEKKDEKTGEPLAAMPSRISGPRGDPRDDLPPLEAYEGFLPPPPPPEAALVTNTSGGMAMDSLIVGRVLPFDRKAYLHSLQKRLDEICPKMNAPTKMKAGSGPKVEKGTQISNFASMAGRMEERADEDEKNENENRGEDWDLEAREAEMRMPFFSHLDEEEEDGGEDCD